MAETYVSLPPNSSGAQVRFILGDATNLIPAGEVAEVVIPSDAAGLFSGDTRQRPAAVTEQTMQDVLLELRRHTLMFASAFGVDIPSAVDADSLTFTEEGASR